MKKLNIINTVLLIGLLCYIVVGKTSLFPKKQAYVITSELFNEFDYQKEINTDYLSAKENKLNELELLKQQIINYEVKIKSGSYTETDLFNYQNLLTEYQSKEFNISQQLSEINAQLTNQVWSKLNSLVTEYGDENGYEVIFGATGTGNIMFADESMNITQDVITYCNLKYSGK